MNQELVPIYSAKDSLLAEMLRAELENLGIQAWIVNDKLGNALGELPPGWSTNPRLLVAADQADKARHVAEEFDRRTSSHIGARSTADNAESADAYEDTLDPWPTCPECHHRRLAVCRICQTSGNNFPLAYNDASQPPGEEPAEDAKVMIVCPGCDEPFYPEFYKLCEHCGHEFPTGRSVRQPAQLRGEDPEVNPTRVYLVLLCVAVIFAAAAGYLWSLSFR